MSLWRYEFRDLATNSLLDEVALLDYRYDRTLNGGGTFSASIPLGDPRITAKDPYTLTTPAYMTVVAYRGEVPVNGGIIWTRQYDSDNERIDFAGADWWSYLDHRLVLPVLPPSPDTAHVAPLVTTYTDMDQSDIARGLVQLAESHAGGDIGLTYDSTTAAVWRDRNYRGYELTSTGEALRKLTGVIDGPDITFGVGGGGPDGKPLRTMRVGTPTLSQPGDPWVAEWGANITRYRWVSDGTRMASRTFAPGDGLESGMPIAVKEDASRYAYGWPLLETIKSYSSVQTPDVLQEHADADQRLARLPVALPVLTLRGDREPVVGVHDVGDTWRVLITDRFFRDGLDTSMRCVRLAVVPEEGGETVELTMTPLLEDAI